MKKRYLPGLIISSFALCSFLFSGVAAAADFNVEANSPASMIVEGNDVTFKWDYRKVVNITRIELVTSANPHPLNARTINPSDNQYTWENFPYGYGWWYVTVFKNNNNFSWGMTSPKQFLHQFPADWEPIDPNKEINYTVKYRPDGRILFLELQRDYSINLPQYILSYALPTPWSNRVTRKYSSWAKTLPVCDWDFIYLNNGVLKIKQGYRWDSASLPCKNLGSASCIDGTFNIRCSLVHDALYDLMRMRYLDPDKAGHQPEGFRNRKMADMMHYMIALEDGQPIWSQLVPWPWPLRDNGAQPDYESLRFWGDDATHDAGKLYGWKYHVSELKAKVVGANVELKWQKANDSGREPPGHLGLKQEEKDLGYNIVRDGNALYWVNYGTTSYTDVNVVNGTTYYYQISKVKNINGINWDDYSNTDQVTVTVDNNAPVVDSGPDDTINEADTFIGSGFFTDPDSYTWTATVDYGDGSGIQSLPLLDNTFELSHIYADNGLYTVIVTVTDDDGGVGMDTVEVTVNNVAPAASIDSVDLPNPLFILPVVHTLTFNGSFTDPGWLDVHDTAWDFDDGTVVDGNQGTLTQENIPPDSTGSLTYQHVYYAPGNYNVTLYVTDDYGDTGTDTIVVNVISSEGAITVINNSIQDLPKDAFKNNSARRKNAFSNKLDEVVELINTGAYQNAIDKLQNDIRAKIDGYVEGNPGNDWIIDQGAQEKLCTMIDDLIAYLETML